MFFCQLMKQYSFNKKERLCSKKQIADLFETGYSFNEFPFKVVWKDILRENDDAKVKLAISVPKKNFKKAVDRNLIKRRIREAYRLNKKDLYDYFGNYNKQINLILIIINKEELSFQEIEGKIIVILQRLINEHKKRISNVKKII